MTRRCRQSSLLSLQRPFDAFAGTSAIDEGYTFTDVSASMRAIVLGEPGPPESLQMSLPRANA